MNYPALMGSALWALLRNKARSLLTILGITIGIAAMICVVAVGEALALVGLDDVVGEARVLGVEGALGEVGLLALSEAELRRGVLDLAEVLDRVAHGQSSVSPAR